MLKTDFEDQENDLVLKVTEETDEFLNNLLYSVVPQENPINVQLTEDMKKFADGFLDFKNYYEQPTAQEQQRLLLNSPSARRFAGQNEQLQKSSDSPLKPRLTLKQ